VGAPDTVESPDVDASAPVRADWGHPEDRDMAALVQTWPELRGTRVDDCRACHCGGAGCATERAQAGSPCDGCHDALRAGALPASTLDAFGLAYLGDCRILSALAALAA